MNILDFPNATSAMDGCYPCIITQQQPELPRDPRREGVLRVRNVGTKRGDDHEAQIEMVIHTFHGRRTDRASVSVQLTKDDARKMAAALLGIDPSELPVNLGAKA